MFEFVDEVWADCLHYYGKDLYEMDGASAMKLAVRLRDIVEVYPDTDPPVFRSSLYRAVENHVPEPSDADIVMSIGELNRIDPTGTVEMVEV